MKKAFLLAVMCATLVGCSTQKTELVKVKDVAPALRKAGYKAVGDEFGTQSVESDATVRMTRYTKYSYDNTTGKNWKVVKKYGRTMKYAAGSGYVMAATPKYYATITGRGKALEKLTKSVLQETAKDPSHDEMTKYLLGLKGTYSAQNEIMMEKGKKIQTATYTYTVYPTEKEAKKHKGIRRGKAVVTVSSHSTGAASAVKKALGY